MYIQVRFTWRGSKLLKHVLQYICLTLAFYTALSRISDYKHHWSDVLAGSLQGIIVAVLIVSFKINVAFFLHLNLKLKVKTDFRH